VAIQKELPALKTGEVFGSGDEVQAHGVMENDLKPNGDDTGASSRDNRLIGIADILIVSTNRLTTNAISQSHARAAWFVDGGSC
jgi:hypothetical protein